MGNPMEAVEVEEFGRVKVFGEGPKEAKVVKPCSCGKNRWKTVKKDVEYQCRGCSKTRKV